MDAMTKKRQDLKKLLDELEAFQGKVGDGQLPDQAEADAMDAKAAEAEALQAEISAHDERTRKNRDLLSAGRRLIDPVTPPDDDRSNTGRKARGEDLAGYMTLGDYVVTQGHLQKWEENGRPKDFALADIPTLLRERKAGKLWVPISRKQREVVETKAIPVLGANVIEPDRLSGIVRVTEHDQLVLRDVLNIVPTSSDTVYWERLVSYTRAADKTEHGAVKPEAAMEVGTASATVDTIAVQIPVNNQQLADYPALAGLINGELLYDLDKRIEELVIWGDGVTTSFLGFAQDPLIQAMRNVAGDTLIDNIRRGITDVRRSGYIPNVIMLDPLDWETCVLQKGTDNRYVWVVVTNQAEQRLWAVRVVETVACEDTMDTGARVAIVGDARVGATLYDRMQSQIQVGWIDDQFIRNRRTILAELRAAWAIRRPDAWRILETEAASS